MQLVIEIRVATSIMVTSTVPHLPHTGNEKDFAYEAPVVIEQKCNKKQNKIHLHNIKFPKITYIVITSLLPALQMN